MQVTQFEKEFLVFADSGEISIITEALRAYHQEMKACGYKELTERSEKIITALTDREVYTVERQK